MNRFSVVCTRDGSNTVYDSNINAYYHSVFGAVQESRYVFIQQGLDVFRLSHQSKPIQLLELGFGTGLNTLLSLEFSVQHLMPIYYVGLEPNPLPRMIWEKLRYETIESISSEARSNFFLLHECAHSKQLHHCFHFEKQSVQIQEFSPQTQFHLVFYDAFAFNAQPELWQKNLFQKIYSWLYDKGVLVTYAAKGEIKRNLKSAGFTVETLKGPPGKREMIRAIKSKASRLIKDE